MKSLPGAGEIKPPTDADGTDDVGKAVANRSTRSHAKANRGTPPPSGIDPTQTLGVTSGESGFQGLNHFDQRSADGGNQYSLTPPDQGMCVGKGQVVEAINNAIRVYDTSGNALDDTASVNQFFWGDHYIDRSTGVNSPHNMGDLSCVYDAGSNRFYIAGFDQVVDAAGNVLGPSFVDFAVSDPGTALAGWTIYQVDTTNDGTDGTPSHHALRRVHTGTRTVQRHGLRAEHDVLPQLRLVLRQRADRLRADPRLEDREHVADQY